MRFLLAVLMAAQCHAAISLIQSNSNFTGGASCTGPSCLVPFLSDNTGGCLVVIAIAVVPGTSVTVTDSRGNAYIHDVSTPDFWQGWHAPNVKAGSNSVTVTNTSGTFNSVGIAEFCGYSPLVAVDKTSSQVSGSGTSWDSGSATTVQNGELIIGYGSFNSGASVIHLGTGFSLVQDIDGDIWEYQIQSTAGSIAATFTSDTAVTGIAFMETFYEPPAPHHSGGIF